MYLLKALAMIVRIIIAYIFKRKEVDSLMINLFAMQVTLGWLKVEDIPDKYRGQVEELLALADGGVK